MLEDREMFLLNDIFQKVYRNHAHKVIICDANFQWSPL